MEKLSKKFRTIVGVKATQGVVHTHNGKKTLNEVCVFSKAFVTNEIVQIINFKLLLSNRPLYSVCNLKFMYQLDSIRLIASALRITPFFLVESFNLKPCLGNVY